MLPDFIIIGAMKCGTSSLYNYLKLHPKIGMSMVKETDFFVEERNYNKGKNWYEGQFRGYKKIHGEASPNYSKHPTFKGVPARMVQIIPKAKIIYLVRDPIRRIMSHYVHNYCEDEEERDINHLLLDLEDNHYVNCSRYYFQIEQYLDFYRRKNILVIATERLRNAREETLSEIFQFLEVENYFNEEYTKEHHKSSSKLKRNKIGKFLRKTGIEWRVENSFPQVLRMGYVKCTKKKVEIPVLDNLLREKLKAYLKKDVIGLRRFTGQDFDFWEI